jgi:hypothetical protein
VARALVNLGSGHAKRGEPARAAELYDQVVAKYGDSAEASLREQVAAARRMRARLQGGKA